MNQRSADRQSKEARRGGSHGDGATYTVNTDVGGLVKTTLRKVQDLDITLVE